MSLLKKPTHVNNLPASPILRWAGSKKAILYNLEELFPESFERYMELFAGSACLYFKIDPKKAIVADNNKDLISFYRVFASNSDEVYKLFSKIPRTPEAYYRIRTLLKSEADEIRRAAYFLYLNRNCFNGIYRTNAKGEFNVPFSQSRVSGYPSKEVFDHAAKKLKRAKICFGDFEKICKDNLRPGDFVYLDPPYYVPNVRVFKEYSSKPFTNDDFDRLSNLLDFINEVGAKFMLSYPDCSLSRKIAKKWSKNRLLVRRIIGGTVGSRKGKYELVIRNY